MPAIENGVGVQPLEGHLLEETPDARQGAGVSPGGTM